MASAGGHGGPVGPDQLVVAAVHEVAVDDPAVGLAPGQHPVLGDEVVVRVLRHSPTLWTRVSLISTMGNVALNDIESFLEKQRRR